MASMDYQSFLDSRKINIAELSKKVKSLETTETVA